MDGWGAACVHYAVVEVEALIYVHGFVFGRYAVEVAVILIDVVMFMVHWHDDNAFETQRLRTNEAKNVVICQYI